MPLWVLGKLKEKIGRLSVLIQFNCLKKFEMSRLELIVFVSRALNAAEAALSNPLLGEMSVQVSKDERDEELPNPLILVNHRLF